MNVPYALVAPVLLTAATITYVVAGPGPHQAHEVAAEPGVSLSETATAVDSPTAMPTRAPTATSTPDAPDALPAGLTGRLTYRTGHTLVTVAFASMDTSRIPDPGVTPGDTSADGLWREQTSCPSTSCYFDFYSADGAQHTSVLVTDFPGWPKWSLEGHALAYSTTPYGAIAARDLVVIEDPASPQPRVIASAEGVGIYSYAWLADGRLLVSLGAGVSGRPHLVAVSLDGTQQRLVDTAATAPYMYPSPDGRLVAFTQSSDKGWHMFVYDTRDGVLHDLGNMGSDAAGTKPPEQIPAGEGKGPMYVAWSPDRAYLAFGGGFEPPYFMTTVDVRSGKAVRTDFPDGYPGEIKWSPDGRLLAVSSYNVPRTHHESYVVDPATGIATDLLSGCVIVWSPDSRFLAIHGEKIPGVAIADVATLGHSQLTHVIGDTPLRWEP